MPQDAHVGATRDKGDDPVNLEKYPEQDSIDALQQGCKRVAPPVDEKLEAKRAANRRASVASRMRQKNLIKDLLEENKLLKSENESLYQKLEACLAENRKLELEHQNALQRNLQLTMLQVQQQVQDQNHCTMDEREIVPLLEQPKRFEMGLEILSSFALKREQERRNSIALEHAQVQSPARIPDTGLLLTSSNVLPCGMPLISDNILRNQMEIIRLQEEVRALRERMARARAGALRN